MEEKRTKGRPAMPAEQRKKNRAFSLTNAQYEEVLAQAAAAGLPNQPSAYLIKKLRLNATPKPKPLTDDN